MSEVVVNLADRQPKWRSVTELAIEGAYVVGRTDERAAGPIGIIDLVRHEGVLGTFEVDEDEDEDAVEPPEEVVGEFEPITSFDPECRFFGPLPLMAGDA